MKRFAQLYQELDESTKTTRKVTALVRYFGDVTADDAAWAVWFLCGNRPRRAVPAGKLREWCAEVSGIPAWLLEETYDFVGDLAETIALLLPAPQCSSTGTLSEWVLDRLLPLVALKEPQKKMAVLAAWQELDRRERFVFNKLLTGGFRVGVSRKLVGKSLAEFSGVPADVIAHRLMGEWKPTAQFFASLLSLDTESSEVSRPYPFCLANSFTVAESEAGSLIQEEPHSVMMDQFGPPENWVMEWKWDGIRAQVIRRKSQTFVWSRGEELLTERFPEVVREADRLPDGTVLDGELVAWKRGQVLPFADLQKRITRKTTSAKLLADVPVRFLAFDVMEMSSLDIRSRPLYERRPLLDQLLSQHAADMQQTMAKSTETTTGKRSRDREGLSPATVPMENAIAGSPVLQPSTWDEAVRLRQTSREQRVEGLMVKRADSEYGVGRVTGLWWKWKMDPWHCDAVLIYAQRGHGRRASKFTDYTFAAWDNGQLVPFAKAYSGLTDAEIREVDKFIRANTLERFGPVQSVKAELVFELAFEGMQLSSRHKAGIAVRFPRIARWRRDKKAEEADTLENIRNLVKPLSEPAIQSPQSAAKSVPDLRLGGLFAGMDDD